VEAENYLRIALQSAPGNQPARQALVALLLEQRRLEDAIPVLQQGLELDAGQTQLAIVLARIQVEGRDYASALDTLNRARARAGTEDNAAFNNLLAAVLQRLSRHREAVEHYQAALRASPDNGPAWIGLAISLENLQRRGDAAEAYRRALASEALSPETKKYAEQKVRELR